jgi:MEDS: MEthanogen/methylotroph, DcmR Sensory domain
VAAGEPSRVVVTARKIALLREALHDDGDGVLFTDMAGVGSNPARIIPAWREFVTAHGNTGRPLRGIGEPIYPQRSSAEMVECHRHEALLNTLDPEVVETARRTHPAVVEGGVAGTSALFDGLDAVAEPFADPLPPPPGDAAELEIDADTLRAVRRFVRGAAAAAPLTAERACDLVVAVNEIATNRVVHGGGRGRLGYGAAGAVRLHMRLD